MLWPLQLHHWVKGDYGRRGSEAWMKFLSRGIPPRLKADSMHISCVIKVYKDSLGDLMNVNREFTIGKMAGTKNDQGKGTDVYLPRKCSATSKILGPKDVASVQIVIPHVDSEGRSVNSEDVFAISGYIRSKGRGDWELEKLLRSKGLYPISDDL